MHVNNGDRSILLFQRVVPSYRVSIFNKLHRELKVIVCHSRNLWTSRDSTQCEIKVISEELLRGWTLPGFRSVACQNVLGVLRRRKPDVVIAQYSLGLVTFWLLLALKVVYKYKLISWSHGIRNIDMVRDKKSMHYCLTPKILSLCDASVLYSENRKNILLKRNPKLIGSLFVANNALDIRLRQIGNVCTGNVSGRRIFTIILIGRLNKQKRLALLLEAYKVLVERYQVRMIVIGEGPDSAILRNSKIGMIEMKGAINDVNVSERYLLDADVQVIPGAVGLSLVHGYTYGLPIVTCQSEKNGPFHGPEVEYLKDGYNGFFCDSTPESIAACIERLILDPELLARMKENALETVRTEANVERMIDGFRAAIKYVESN